MKRIFPKPHPLSPNTRAIETDGKMYFLSRKGNTLAAGVKTTKSVYYWWFEYLRRNKLYREACDSGKIHKKVSQVFADFGNIFEFCPFDFTQPETQFSTDKQFWEWWQHTGENRNAKGAYLFSFEPAEMEPTFVGLGDLRDYKDDVASGDVKLIAISACHSKSELRQKITKLLSKEFEQTEPPKREGKHTPNYDIAGEVNIDVLKRDLLLWDARNNGVKGKELMNIYIENSNFKEGKLNALRASFKGIRNYLYGWELKDNQTLEKEFGWIRCDDETGNDDTDDYIVVGNTKMEEYIPPELELKISEYADYARQNSFKRYSSGDEAPYIWAYVKLGLAQRTEAFKESKKMKNSAYISINRSISRAEANINATGVGKFNLTTKEARLANK